MQEIINNQIQLEPVMVRFHSGEVSQVYKDLLLSSAQLLLRLNSDYLTELKSRSFIQEYTVSLMQHMDTIYDEGYVTGLTLFYIDINHFKKVNDSLGHEEGDNVIRNVGHSITNSLRSSDFVSNNGYNEQTGRLHGDEFIVIVPQIDALSLEDLSNDERAEIIKNRIKEKVKRQTGMDISIGFSFYVSGEEYAELVKRADTAMYFDKRTSQGSVK